MCQRRFLHADKDETNKHSLLKRKKKKNAIKQKTRLKTEIRDNINNIKAYYLPNVIQKWFTYDVALLFLFLYSLYA